MFGVSFYYSHRSCKMTDALKWTLRGRYSRTAAGMLGSAIGKGDGDAATFTKKEKKDRMSSTLKG
jgi:hypothetical protein